ncbi:hypothetical protein MUK71_11670 [Arthrobacter zhangbolii]|uniref:Fis family transcriptional regulator n=1 Tax=Arthrobacter zhangbolii TaxID=2886936 RepID=A0A9X1M9Z9_9MICC|nr:MULTISPECIES: hypothetical protein [Arthrobacter]MCC3274011.1 hypothetical protein [Arthrobacter zhangbolii]MDN3903977.1 hypothetical protein [Arthrobacter sp. YD2]UON91260.1 hypothetical protein MUK71_11670 [Arthrobacter zhangbolii]
MRWDALFRDMEAQMAAADERHAAGEISERVRVELGGISLQDRLRSQSGRELVVDLGRAGTLRGVLRHVGAGWVVLERERGSALAALAHVVSVRGLDRFAEPAARALNLGIASALREISRDRSIVALRLAGKASGEVLHGTIDRVGADFVELAVVAAGEERRPGNVSAVHLLPTSAVAAVLTQQHGWG